jgi:hypothetical protein
MSQENLERLQAAIEHFGRTGEPNYLWPLKGGNPQKRALHDIVARTRVVNTEAV